MHILYVAPYVPSRLRPRPFSLIAQMITRGHRVTAVVMRTSRVNGESSDDLETLGVTVKVVDQPKWRALFSCARSLPSFVPLQAAYCESRSLDTEVARNLTNTRIDVIHVEHLRAARYGIGVRTVPRVYDGVDCMSLLWARTAKSGMLSRRLLARWELPRTRRFESDVLAEYSRVLVSSDADAAAMRALVPAVLPKVIPNGVDSSYFAAVPWNPEPDTLVFSGRMAYHANEQAVLALVRNVLPAIWAHRPGVRLIIVGASPSAAVRALSKNPAITVTGFVPDLRPFLARAAVALCPISVGAGTQFKVLEAMAAGVPVVTSSVAACPLGLRHERQALVADDDQATVAAVMRLLEDRGFALRLHSSAQEFVRRHFSWAAIGDGLEKTYLEAIAEERLIRTGLTAGKVPMAVRGGELQGRI